MKKVKIYTNTKDDGRLHEYDIKTYKMKNDNVRHELYYSDNDVWTEHTKRQLILTVIDHADDFVLKFKFNQQFDFGNLEHDQAQFMFVMLKYIQKLQKSHKLKFKSK